VGHRHHERQLADELGRHPGSGGWQWQPESGNAVVNPVSGKCLDDRRLDTADGTQLEIFTCDGGENQQWLLPPTVTVTSSGRMVS
jgi:hypothetical protein